MPPIPEPPLITSQMPWWEASLWLSILPVACLLFRWFVRGPMAHTFRNSYTLRAGIVIAGILLAGGFISAGHALRKVLSYTRVEKEGIRQVQLLQKEKFKRWDELVGAELRDWKTLKAKTSEELGMTTNVTLEFKEGGRWREYVTFSSDVFSDADFRRFQEWLNANLTMEPQAPSPWQKRFENTRHSRPATRTL